MKKVLLFVLTLSFVIILAACGTRSYEIAMITDAGDIDDESFNQGTWEGIVEFADDRGISHEYYRPEEISDAAYLNAISLAIDGGAEIIVTPGFLFEVAIYEAQDMYPDVKFILIDGQPNDGDWGAEGGPDFHTADNTVSIFFEEEESGFLAGYAAVKDGFADLGFMGGMAVPAVVRFGVGYVAGAYYAANEEGININFPDNRYVYLGDFDPSDTHRAEAEGWYNAGTDIIFAAAGGAGSSVMRAAEDSDNWMIGVDIDQGTQSSAVLTSAMKALAVAVQTVLADHYDDDAFPGGEVLNLGAAEDGVGLPTADDSWRFSDFTIEDYETIFDLIASGAIVVPSNYSELDSFMSEHDLGEFDIEEGTIEP